MRWLLMFVVFLVFPQSVRSQATVYWIRPVDMSGGNSLAEGGKHVREASFSLGMEGRLASLTFK